MLLQINELLNQIFTMPLLGLKEKMLCGLDVYKLNSMIFLMHAIGFFLYVLMMFIKRKIILQTIWIFFYSGSFMLDFDYWFSFVN
jgi:uncharacterized membrane protein (DUF4010 family)